VECTSAIVGPEPDGSLNVAQRALVPRARMLGQNMMVAKVPDRWNPTRS
jgi:hypothetical protein